MNIIAGLARGVELSVPPGIPVRPTAGRVRKALFDSLGDLTGIDVLDICAGSGALALEALSRNAASAALVEISQEHIAVINENIRRVRSAGVDNPAWVIQCDAVKCENYLPRLHHVPGIIFADPPYAESPEIFAKLFFDPYFRKSMAGAELIWEIPDHPGAAGEFLRQMKSIKNFNLRRFAGTMFLMVRV